MRNEPPQKYDFNLHCDLKVGLTTEINYVNDYTIINFLIFAT